ncbi:MAG: hypothetical protein K2H85_03730 [Allobaculum sp.]|nr:hypothetical protein [Allobaculum sp.]
MDSIDLERYFPQTNSPHKPSIPYGQLLKAWLFAQTAFPGCSLRKMESLCKTDIRLMSLTHFKAPSFMRFKRVLDKISSQDMHRLWVKITQKIAQKEGFSFDTVYVDGTKLEAYANRYTFIYRKRTVNYWKKKNIQIDEKIESLCFDLGYDLLKQEWYESTDLFDICLLLIEEMEEKKIELVYGRGSRKSIPQRYYDWFLKTGFKLLQYEMDLETMEEHRNSFSKTDHDVHVS